MTIQKLKTVSLPVLLSILLPVFDVFSDLRLIILLFLGGFQCIPGSDDYLSCKRDTSSYCAPTATTICEPVNHPLFAVMLLIPFLLNYIMSFITWWRLNINKTFSFIFALLNLFAPYGKVIISDV